MPVVIQCCQCGATFEVRGLPNDAAVEELHCPDCNGAMRLLQSSDACDTVLHSVQSEIETMEAPARRVPQKEAAAEPKPET